MEPYTDVALFDCYVRNLQKGGVAYRDWCEVNLPGMPWLQWAARSVAGWSSEAIRTIDFLIVASALGLLFRWSKNAPPLLRILFVSGLLVFYVSQSEWCHVQRDTWMLLPALAALHLRRWRLAGGSTAWLAFAEGMLWAVALWIKPHVAVPVVTVWLASVRIAGLDIPSVRRVAFDGLVMVCGGLLVGALGVFWLVKTGAWPYLMEMETDWGREYFGFDVTFGRRWLFAAGMLVRMFPWMLIHVVAVPMALRRLWRNGNPSLTLMAALYLGWLAQVVLIQHLFDYVHTPPILLAFAVVFGEVMDAPGPLPRRLFFAFLLVCVIFRVPVLLNGRLAAWPRCWCEGSSPGVRNLTSGLHKVDWDAFGEVADYLRSRGVRDGELTCFNISTADFYRALDVEPATRYHFFENNWLSFPGKRPLIHAQLSASRQRFVVCDLSWPTIGLTQPDVNMLPAAWQRWKKRIVFQAGQFIVLEMAGAETVPWLEECFPNGDGRPIGAQAAAAMTSAAPPSSISSRASRSISSRRPATSCS
jgi:hypothetical protein